MSERREGWYWVRFGIGESDDWCVIEYTSLGFKISPSTHISDNWLADIGPRIPTPDEPFKCVPAEPTEEMVDAASEAYMPFGDMALAIQAAIAYAPEVE